MTCSEGGQLVEPPLLIDLAEATKSPSASLAAQNCSNVIALRLISSWNRLLVNAIRQLTQSAKVVVSVSVI